MSEKEIQPADPKTTNTSEADKAAEADDKTADRKTNSGRFNRESGRKTSSSRWH